MLKPNPWTLNPAPLDAQAMEILRHRLRDDTAGQEVLGSGHVADGNGKSHAATNGTNGGRGTLQPVDGHTQAGYQLHRTGDYDAV